MPAMIEVTDVVKHYGVHPALRGVSFSVERGNVVGFLGPNGAGKTTALRIITGFLQPTSGQVAIDGIDVAGGGKEPRRRLGYLPENAPLYPEMRVCEYLAFRAALKAIPAAARAARLAFVLNRCGLETVQRQIIGTLSKGYRQRTGLADALLADPPLIILDEPTAGLDPNQTREVRTLIRELAGSHTVLLSTHILPEVEAVCDRVVIIHRGAIVAEGTPAELERDLRGTGQVSLAVNNAPAGAAAALGRVAGVQGVAATTVGTLTTFAVAVAEAEAAAETIFRCAAEQRWSVRELRARRASLEDMFAELTVNQPDPARAESAPAAEVA